MFFTVPKADIITWNPSRVVPEWEWATRGLVWAALPGGAQRQELLGHAVGSLVNPANVSWHGVEPRVGPALEATANASGAVWERSRVMERRIKNDFTIAVLANFSSYGAATSYVFCVPYDETWTMPYLSLAMVGLSTNVGRLYYGTGSTYRYAQTTNYFALNVLDLWVMVRKGNKAYFYKSGVLHEGDVGFIGSPGLEDVGFDVGRPCTTNRNQTSTGSSILGRISMISVWNYALTGGQITRLHRDPFGPFRAQFVLEFLPIYFGLLRGTVQVVPAVAREGLEAEGAIDNVLAAIQVRPAVAKTSVHPKAAVEGSQTIRVKYE